MAVRRVGSYLTRYPNASSDRLVRLDNTPVISGSATVYIKGFLTQGESPETFNAWLDCHKKLEQQFNWSTRVFGYCWQSGSILSFESPLGKFPVPIASLLHFSFRGLKYVLRGSRLIPSPLQLASIAAQEIGLSVGNLIYQYKSASAHIDEHAHVLAFYLETLRRERGISNLRIVAHSLGCKLLLKSLNYMKKEERPDEIYLCAPALHEDEYKEILSTAARQRTIVLYNPNDLVLGYVFPIIEMQSALGCEGPIHSYGPQCHFYSVEDFFDFMVHAEYRHRFDKLATYVNQQLQK